MVGLSQLTTVGELRGMNQTLSGAGHGPGAGLRYAAREQKEGREGSARRALRKIRGVWKGCGGGRDKGERRPYTGSWANWEIQHKEKPVLCSASLFSGHVARRTRPPLDERKIDSNTRG